MHVALAGLDQGDFTEARELDRKWQVSKEMVGRRLSQEEAKRLLAKFG
jgi:Zn-dependent peptidase ImmA (M78 family)